MKDKYIFKTENKRNMNIVVNRYKLLSALEELSDWRRQLYKGYDNSIKYMCNGKIYTYQELEEDKTIPRDDIGIIKDCTDVYTIDNIISKIDYILSDVNEYICE